MLRNDSSPTHNTSNMAVVVVSPEVTIAHDRLYDAAMKMVSENDTAAYYTACQQAFHLVVTESNPLWFLAVEHDNVQKASHRICQYWTMRFHLFQERALLPLDDLTGQGALSLVDIENIQQNKIVVLPKDAFGRTVLCIDGTVRYQDNESDASSWQRIWFYMLGHCVTCNPLSQVVGWVLLFATYTTHTINNVREHAAAKNLLAVFPIQPPLVFACHIVPNNAAIQPSMIPVSTFKSRFW
jgi:hypothetical protein